MNLINNFTNLVLVIYGVEILFLIAFLVTLTFSFELRNIALGECKEGWDKINISIFLIVIIIFIGIYYTYKDFYREYKTRQKEQQIETTKNWTKQDWENYEAQQEDYQCVGGSCQNE